MRHLDELWLTRDRECRWCGREIFARTRASSSPLAASVEHLLPLARGGTYEPHNITLAHRQCNNARGAAGHCIAALCCALSVLGGDATLSEIHHWFNRTGRRRWQA